MSPSLQALRTTALRTTALRTTTLRTTTRLYHATPSLRLPYKNSQDKDSLRPGSTENTQSGRDNEAAADPDKAFNPNKTRPEPEDSSAVNGGDHGLSKPMGEGKEAMDTGPGKEVRKGGKSGGKV